MTQKEPRVFVALEGTPFQARLVPHKLDSSRVMVKTVNRGCLELFFKATGVVPYSEITTGTNYFMAQADRQEVVNAVTALMNKALLGTTIPGMPEPFTPTDE